MTNYYEAEVIVGIESIAIEELKQLSIQTLSIQVIRPGFIRFRYNDKIKKLNELRSIIAIYAIHQFDIPRPKALLGHEHFTRLISLLSQQIQSWDTGHSLTFGLGVAGSESSVIQRLKSEIAKALQIIESTDSKGELFWRLIPAYKRDGWEVLIRLTPRPLATRVWRTNHIPGALNATVAYAMTQLVDEHPNLNIVNLCSGTGTILIEHASHNNSDNIIGIDNDLAMLQYATEHIQKNPLTSSIQQIRSNAQQTPLPDAYIDRIYADLPFGHHMGSHDTNEWLYPAILEEAARIAKSTACFIVITHEIQLLEESILSSRWIVTSQLKINLNGLHPRIFVLELR